MSQRESRGIRNHNPGNIRKSKDKWQGLASDQPDSEFFTFKDPTYGIRAMARLLINYQDKYGLRTVYDIIHRWAPPVGSGPKGSYTQNTRGYVTQVSNHMKVDPNDEIDLHNFRYLYPLVEAMIKHENGYQPYSESQITKGLVLAGVEPKEKPLAQSRTMTATQVAAGGTAMTMLAENLETITPAIPLLQTVAQYAPLVFGVIVLACLGWIAWSRYDDRRKGLR